MADVAAPSTMTLPDRLRRVATGASLTLPAWLCLAAFLTICWALGFSPDHDADDLLKLAKIRAYLDTGAWFDQTVPGILQPEPFVSHWPRLLDLPYALLAWAMEPFVGPEAALKASALALPLLLLLPALALYKRMLFALDLGWPALVFAVSVVAALRSFFEFAPERIDYHNVQILLLLASIVLTFSSRRRAAAANGVVIVLALSTSVEFAPFYAVLVATYVFEFIVAADGASQRLSLLGSAIAAAALAAFPLIVAPADYSAAACDRYSMPHLLLFVSAGGGLALAGLADRVSVHPLPRTAAVAVAGIGPAAVVLLLFSTCLAGPYAALDDFTREHWLLAIGQERSLFTRPDFVLSAGFLNAAIMFAGALAPLVVAARGKFRNRKQLVFSLMALVAVAMSLAYFRYLRYLPLFAYPGLLMVLADVFLRRAAPERAHDQTTMLVALAPGIFLSIALVTYHFIARVPIREATAIDFVGACNVTSTRISWPRGARIMAPRQIGVRLLTGLEDAAVVAVPFHTASSGIKKAYRFFEPGPADPRTILDASLATHVAVCATGEGSTDLPASAFAKGLMEGRAPDWLVGCPQVDANPVHIYRYPDGGAAGASCPTPR